MTQDHIDRMYRMVFADIYPMYVEKVTRKGRTREELDTVIAWLTGYDAAGLAGHIARRTTFEDFFAEAPAFNPLASKITGVICGYRVEDIAEPLVQKVRYLDKLVDEVAKGRAMEKVLRG